MMMCRFEGNHEKVPGAPICRVEILVGIFIIIMDKRIESEWGEELYLPKVIFKCISGTDIFVLFGK